MPSIFTLSPPAHRLGVYWEQSWNQKEGEPGSLHRKRIGEPRRKEGAVRESSQQAVCAVWAPPACFCPAFTSLQVLELRRPMDSRLEHVDFECLFTCLSVRQLIRIFASLLLERRVIFVADKLRYGPEGAEEGSRWHIH